MDMKVYACGGTGLNIGGLFEKWRDRQDIGFSPMNVCFIDTSRANVEKLNTDAENVYLFEGTNGAGKDRRNIYSTVVEHKKEILLKFKPSDNVNVVLHSLGGGSGSVIGPVLVSELLKKDVPVIVVCIGSSDSRKEIDNTIKTIQSYENMSRTDGAPISCLYFENSAANPRGTVDREVFTSMAMISAFFSEQNHEMDKKDLTNFLKFTGSTSHPAQLAYLEFFSGDIELQKGTSLISLATLTTDDVSATPSVPVEYQAVGFLPEGVAEKLGSNPPIHAALIDGVFPLIVDNLKARMDTIDEQRNAHVRKSLEIDGDVQSDGMVF